MTEGLMHTHRLFMMLIWLKVLPQQPIDVESIEVYSEVFR